jgi:hypothetical protein
VRPSWLAKLFSREKRNEAVPPRTSAESRASRPPPPASRARMPVAPEPELIVPRRLRAGAPLATPPPPSSSPAAPPAESFESVREPVTRLDPSARVTVDPSRVTIEPPPAESAVSTAPTRSNGPNGAGRSSDELVSTTRMAPQEELSIKVGEGLGKLSALLSSIDEKLVAQHRATELVAERLQALPRVLEGLVETERRSLQTLDELRTAMDKQGRASEQTAEKLGQLPPLVEGLGARVEKQTEASASVRTSVESVGHSVRGLVDGAQRANNSLVTEFRRGQDEQRQRLEELVERQRKVLWVVAGLCAVVAVVLVIALSKLAK